MKKIPTLFVRDENDRRYVTDPVTPGCEWVIAGEGVATRKYDGTCVMFDGTEWWARRETKVGKPVPNRYIDISTDPITGKTVGWEPIGQSSFAKFHTEALTATDEWKPGTYELVGPKINGNPEGYSKHTLIRHATAETLVPLPGPRSPHDIRHVVTSLGWEGIVWHHPDGQMVKLKARDYPRQQSTDELDMHNARHQGGTDDNESTTTEEKAS